MLQEQTQRWQRRKDERPSEIIDAALEIFVEHGYAASKLDDIAKKAGVSKGSLYRYFDSKADLFKEMVKQVVIPQIENAAPFPALSFWTASASLLISTFRPIKSALNPCRRWILNGCFFRAKTL